MTCGDCNSYYTYRYILLYAARVVRNNPVFRTINIHPKSWMQTHKKDPKNIRPVSSFFFFSVFDSRKNISCLLSRSEVFLGSSCGFFPPRRQFASRMSVNRQKFCLYTKISKKKKLVTVLTLYMYIYTRPAMNRNSYDYYYYIFFLVF